MTNIIMAHGYKKVLGTTNHHNAASLPTCDCDKTLKVYSIKYTH